MITSITELAAVHAVMEEDLRAVCARKIARLSGRPVQAPAQIIPLHRGFVVREPDPLPQGTLREFVAIIKLCDGTVQEPTRWATSSMEVLVGEVERLAREGEPGAHIEVRPVVARRGAA